MGLIYSPRRGHGLATELLGEVGPRGVYSWAGYDHPNALRHEGEEAAHRRDEVMDRVDALEQQFAGDDDGAPRDDFGERSEGFDSEALGERVLLAIDS